MGKREGGVNKVEVRGVWRMKRVLTAMSRMRNLAGPSAGSHIRRQMLGRDGKEHTGAQRT